MVLLVDTFKSGEFARRARAVVAGSRLLSLRDDAAPQTDPKLVLDFAWTAGTERRCRRDPKPKLGPETPIPPIPPHRQPYRLGMASVAYGRQPIGNTACCEQQEEQRGRDEESGPQPPFPVMLYHVANSGIRGRKEREERETAQRARRLRRARRERENGLTEEPMARDAEHGRASPAAFQTSNRPAPSVGNREDMACRDSAPSGMTSLRIPARGSHPITAPPAIGLTKTNTPPSRPPESKNDAFGAHRHPLAAYHSQTGSKRLNAPPQWGISDARRAELRLNTGCELGTLGYTSWFGLGPTGPNMVSVRFAGLSVRKRA
ncbi:uncharacterized protein B0H64DRAFT_376762 [Chaetomium fimeti]|uniref:Uncharacterized protein n=1 Tax=Chaetomium fimeti TaxID=1854472 RepID=A0AAE0LP29_9PEZI|nr:hypothetical protein B0H64DRAFT_376762 [Chaetomium fimeti]